MAEEHTAHVWVHCGTCYSGGRAFILEVRYFVLRSGASYMPSLAVHVCALVVVARQMICLDCHAASV